MTKEEQFQLCLEQARGIVARYRAEAPDGCDPQNTMGISAAAWVAIAVSVAGAAVSAYGQYQQGKAADMMAKYNAHQQEYNARMQLMSMQAESEARKQQAEANYRLRNAEAQAKFSNAKQIESQAEAQSRNARESMRRKAEELGRFASTQRANIAASGVVESSGTPLDILAETAGKIQLEREDNLYADEMNRRSLFREADLERLGGKLAQAGATLDRSSEVFGANLQAATGQAQYRSAMREAELTRLAGAAQKYTSKYAAAGTLLSGASSAYGMYSSMPKTATTTTAYAAKQ